MPFLKSHPDNAGPANVFTAYPDIFGHWTKMGQALMNAPSPFTTGEREMIAAYTVGVAQCEYAYVAHSAAAYAWEIEEGLVDKLLADLDGAPIDDKFKPLLAFVRKLAVSPGARTPCTTPSPSPPEPRSCSAWWRDTGSRRSRRRWRRSTRRSASSSAT